MESLYNESDEPQSNEKARVDGRQISSEWHDNIVLIKPETFLPIFMYGQPDPTTTDEGTVTSLSSSQRGARDEQLAKECLEALKSQDKSRKFNQVVQSLATHGLLRQMGDISPGISPYAADRFTKIVTNINSERDSYGRLTSSTPDAGGKRITEAHPYSTTTLPFIAYDFLPDIEEGEIPSIKHEVHHDAESVFWVVLSVVLPEEQSYRAKRALRWLLPTNSDVDMKRNLLAGLLDTDSKASDCIRLDGRYKDLAPFLGSFASACWDRYYKNTRDFKLDDLLRLIDRTMTSLPQGSGETSVETSKRRRESVEGQEERVAGTSSEPSGYHFKKICLGQGVQGEVP